MKVNKSHRIERLGVVQVAARVNDLGWLFRENPNSDFGIDGHIEIVSDERATGKLIAVQIKSGTSFFSEKKNDGYVYRGNIDHLRYWLNHSLPVIVIIWNNETNECLWQSVSFDTAKRTGKHWKMRIPTDHVLDESSIELLEELSEGTPYILRFRQLVMNKPWMNILRRSGRRLFLEVEQWANKSSGRGDFTLVIEDENESKKTVAEWPFVLLPGIAYEMAIPLLFPWATFEIDHDLYHSYDESNWHGNCGSWDSEDQCYVFHTMTFAEWRSRLPKGIRPYQFDGEIAHWRLELKLNDLGKAFLRIDRYLNKK